MLDRRSFLTAAVAALGASAIARGDAFGASAQGPAARAQRIDIHHHFAPPAWIAEVMRR